ncbi:hypothetical protein [Pseudodonghicola xiamenensis]|uniref:Uncharacterized protein n=1 Tax=Pseudodonghicola xiamenensis TaxID=337702 RepID=A0A8J3HAN6_9RHOB|nr:hypothetical protein [Pseudodonghicola xiamenensis]GHG97332.1 hypothetical protein GCM10010961_32130 [Pseudodonghicola xiamenensis]
MILTNVAPGIGKTAAKELARQACFRLSDRASFITGPYHLLGGGHTAPTIWPNDLTGVPPSPRALASGLSAA